MGGVRSALADVADSSLRIAITGASGWLGRELTDLLLESWGPSAGDRLLLLASKPRTVTLASGTMVSLHGFDKALVESFAPTHVVHLAFLTRERLGEISATDYETVNLSLTQQAMQLTRIPSVRGLLFTSSGAAVAAPTGTQGDLYGTLKRNDEVVLPATAAGLNKSCVTARIWSVSGANMQKAEHFALGSLITQAMVGSDLEVRANHPVFRRYVDGGEFLGLCLLELLSERSGVIDSAGERIEVGELASRIAGILSPGSLIRRPPMRHTPVDDFTANPSTMARAAANNGVQLLDLEGQILRTSSGIDPHR